MKINRFFVTSFIGLLLASGLVFSSCSETTNIYQYPGQETPGQEIPGPKIPDPEEIDIEKQKELAKLLGSYINDEMIDLESLLDMDFEKLLKFIDEKFEGCGVSFTAYDNGYKDAIDKIAINKRVHIAKYQGMVNGSSEWGYLFKDENTLNFGSVDEKGKPEYSAYIGRELLDSIVGFDDIQVVRNPSIVGFTTLMLNHKSMTHPEQDTIDLVSAGKSIFNLDDGDIYTYEYDIDANKNKLVEEDVLGK